MFTGNTMVADCKNSIGGEGWLEQCYLLKDGEWSNVPEYDCRESVRNGATELDISTYATTEWPDDAFVVLRFTIPDCGQQGLWALCHEGGVDLGSVKTRTQSCS